MAGQLAVKTRKHGTKGSSCASAIDQVYLLALSVNFLSIWVIWKEQRLLRKVVPGARRSFNGARFAVIFHRTVVQIMSVTNFIEFNFISDDFFLNWLRNGRCQKLKHC